MKLSEVKAALKSIESVDFQLESGAWVPEHFHVTEVGQVSKHFIDCGGVVRQENTVTFQLWDAQDFEHRLKPQKLLTIIELSEARLGVEDGEVEVEFQGKTIEKYDLEFSGTYFLLKNKFTACLAPEKCLPQKPKWKGSEQSQSSSCTPGSGCC